MKYICIITLIFSSFLTKAQTVSRFNQKTIINDTVADYAFLVSGHFYGGSENKSGFPANTLLANLDLINNSKSSMLICLGDLFKDVKNDQNKYQTSFFSKLEIPLFNTPGNHDLSGDFYQKKFGKTSYFFKLGADFHLFLDTEENNGDISKNQVDLLIEIKNLLKEKSKGNLFIYLHRTIWKDSYAEMDNLFKDNTQSLAVPNFEEVVLPVLLEISKSNQVYCFSGSIGGEAPASFFYHKDESSGITYIATAIRALPRDAMLKVSVKKGKVSFETISLTGEKLKGLESYNLDYWESTSGEEPFNWRLAPLYLKNTFLSRYFWYGVLWTTGGFLFLILIIRWRKKRKLN